MTLFGAQVQPVVDGRAAHAKHTMRLHLAQTAIHRGQHFQSEIFTVAASHKSSVAYISLLAIVSVRRNNERAVNHFRFSHALFLQIVELVKERVKNENRRRPWDSSSVFMLEMANHEVGLDFYQCVDAHFTESESKHTHSR